MKSTLILIRLGLLAVMISALAGCGGSDGAAGAAGVNGQNGAPGPTSVVQATNLTAAQWLALKPSIDPASISVTISSPPVVKFTVKDQYGNPLVGLGGQSQASGALTPKNYNMMFTLAKLVPGSLTADGSLGPSHWVNYLVTTPTAAGTANASPVTDGLTWKGTYPTPEQEGTLVDNGDGTYQYTFLRDVKHAKAIVASLTDAGNNFKADLGDLTYDPTLTHRLGIIIQGSQPGTGANTPNAVQVTTPVPMVNTFNIGYDFRPDGGTITTTRDIVKKDSCTECHQGRGIGHFSPNNTTTTNPSSGAPAGSFIGRNDPRLCVTCHTDQTKYGFAEAPTVAGSGTHPLGGYDDTSSIGYKRVNGEAAFTYPRMIHQTHMGNKLVKTGYNLNAHAKKSNGTTGCDSTSSNAGQCYNLVEYPQDVRNCTKCHDGSATAVNKTKDGDNWMNVPSALACGACHDGINFATGSGQALKDKGTATQTGHLGGAQPDSACTACHTASGGGTAATPSTVVYHGPVSASNARGMPASAVASLRTLSATITAAAVDASGGVTVSFTLADSAGGPVDYTTTGVVPVTQGTSPAGLPFKGLNFTLAKLMPASNGASTFWKSYTGKCNVNNATPNPDMVGATAGMYHTILQGYSEIEYGQAAVAPVAGVSAGKPAMAPGILTSLGGGQWTYKFALVNASAPGDIRTITSAINLNTTAPTAAGGAYSWSGSAGFATCADPDAGYDANLTHRIGMIFTTNPATGTAVDNVTNATFDFVPAGGTVKTTRNIVTMASCATCHAGRKIHKGYATELCVTCHNQNTSDPSAANATTTVDLQFIVHKLHYKGTGFVLHGEAFGTGNMVGFPGNVMKCQVCHNENATKPGTSTKLENAANWYTTPTSRACGTCHDDTVATAHITSQISSGVEMCVTCHGAGSADGLDAKTVHGKLLP